MNISVVDVRSPVAVNVVVNDEALTVELDDGRRLSAPVVWYPRLAYATHAERSNYRLIEAGLACTGRISKRIWCWKDCCRGGALPKAVPP